MIFCTQSHHQYADDIFNLIVRVFVEQTSFCNWNVIAVEQMRLVRETLDYVLN